ncbi:MAG: hypothetical protein JWO05_3439 [Gemmatimonadetes bacterium]|nr:hypothetical protein [Gemmatimonadota bacterium]
MIVSHLRRTLIGAALALAVIPAMARAQLPAPTQPYASELSIDPFGIPFGYLDVEGNTSVGGGATIGLAFSHYSPASSDDPFTNVDFKLRYFPNELPFKGFSVGLTGGWTKQRGDEYNGNFTTSTKTSVSSPTLGVIVDYDWLLGARKRFAVGLGIGAKRLFASKVERDRIRLDAAAGIFRFQLGYAF